MSKAIPVPLTEEEWQRKPIFARKIPTQEEFENLRIQNNPNNEPTGHFTGRCSECGSKDLWTDNLTYGCECCGAIFILN